MKIRFVQYISALIMGAILANSCKKEVYEDIPITESKPFVLIWNKSDQESKTDLETGLRWYFSMLGATLSNGRWDKGVVWENSSRFKVNFKELGFNANAEKHLIELTKFYMASEEYDARGGIDLGRFMANTLNNSNHYYKIVGLPELYFEFLSFNNFTDYVGAINPSSVSFGYRKILFPTTQNSKMTFVAEEYEHDFTSSHQTPVEFEVLDVMPNGQLRFGVYEKGKLISGANAAYSAGGKPTKCMWCHESVFLPNFDDSQSFEGFVSGKSFNDTIKYRNQNLVKLRAELETVLDYSKKQDHVQMELLYIRFFEPSAQRLANEWGISVSDVQTRLSQLKTHQHYEFPELGDLYYRHEVEPLAPFSSLPSPLEMRETEASQPEIL